MIENAIKAEKFDSYPKFLEVILRELKEQTQILKAIEHNTSTYTE